MKNKIKKNVHIDSSFDSFLKESGIYEEVYAAVKLIVEETKRKNKKPRKKRGLRLLS